MSEPTIEVQLGEESFSLEGFRQTTEAAQRAVTIAARSGVDCPVCIWRAAEEALAPLGDDWITRADLIMLNPLIPEELEPHFLLALGENNAACPRSKS